MKPHLDTNTLREVIITIRSAKQQLNGVLSKVSEHETKAAQLEVHKAINALEGAEKKIFSV